MNRYLLICLFVILFALPAFSQDIGSVFGKVQTLEKAALRDVMVRLDSDSLFSGYFVAQTDNRGQFRFNNLPSGSYILSLKKDGYNNLVLPPFRIQFKASQKLNLTMLSSNMQDVLSLSQKAGQRDITKSSASKSFTYANISGFSNLRNLINTLERMPGFNDFSGYGSVRESGSVIKVNDVPVMDPGKGLLAAQVSQLAISEIQVDMFGASASSPANMGPAINLVTRRGGKVFTGELSVFTQSADWTGDNTAAYLDQGIKVPVASSFLNPAVAIGGPVVESRLWFFSSFNSFSRNSDRQISDKVIDVSRNSTQYSFSLSAEISKTQKAYFHYFSNSDDISHQPWKDIWLDNYEYSLHKKDSYFDLMSLEHNFIADDSLVLNTKASMFTNGLDLQPIEVGEIQYDQALGKFLSGTKNSHTRSESGTRQNLSSNLNYFIDSFLGRHSLNIGMEYERKYYERLNDQQALGLYWNGEKYKFFDFGRLETESRIRRFSFYLDDSWSLNPKLTVNFGIRADSTNHISTDPENSPSGSTDFITFNDLSYRIGFAYDAFGDGKTIVKGSAGRFFKTPFVSNTEPLFSYYPDTRLYYGASILGPAVGDKWVLWDQYNNRLPLVVDPNLGNEYSEGFYFGVERELDLNYSVSLDFVWKKDHNIIGITYPEIAMSFSNVNHEGLRGDYSGAYYNIVSRGSYALYSNPEEGDPGVSAPLYRKYYSMTASLARALANNISFNASYTFSRNEGTVDNSSPDILYGQDYFSDPNYYTNRDGRLNLERPHALKISVTLILPLDVTVSSFFRFLSGTPYAPEITPGTSTLLAAVNDGSMRMDDQYLLDLRIQKSVFFENRYQLSLFADLFNAFNSDALTSYVSLNLDSENYLKPGSIVNARFFQLGLRFSF